MLVDLRIQSILLNEICKAQLLDEWCIQIRKKIVESDVPNFNITGEVLRSMNHLCFPKISYLRHKILFEAHNSFYIIHPRV